MKQLLGLLSVIVLSGAALSAHIMVSPPQAKPGATQTYELRVHNEGKIATASLELDIPADVNVTSVDAPPAGTIDTKKSGDRITTIVWTVAVAPSKYLAVKFVAKNPARDAEVHWNVREHLADGSVVEWSDKPGAAEKASVTKISASTN
jgi:uncharacterized protein YcnI